MKKREKYNEAPQTFWLPLFSFGVEAHSRVINILTNRAHH